MSYVLLWSEKQNDFKIEPIEVMLSNNRSDYKENKAGDFRVLFIGTLTDVSEAANACCQTLESRKEAV